MNRVPESVLCLGLLAQGLVQRGAKVSLLSEEQAPFLLKRRSELVFFLKAFQFVLRTFQFVFQNLGLLLKKPKGLRALMDLKMAFEIEVDQGVNHCGCRPWVLVLEP